MIVYRVRDIATGELVCYGKTTELLQTGTRAMAQGFVEALLDNNIAAEIVEFEVE